MIDAANFEPQGKPTPDQVRAVYESMYANGKPPSSRKLHKELVKRGFDISHSSVGRYKKNGFRELITPGSSKPVDEKIRASENALKRATTIKQATTLKKMPGTEDGTADAEPQSGIAAAVAPPIEAQKLAERIARMKALMDMTEGQVAEIESKTRRVYNIILMEESIEIADKLATIPKDNSMMVVAQAEGIAKTTVMMPDTSNPPGAPRRFDPSDPRVIDNQPDPVDPLAAAINDFLRKEGIAA